MKFHTKHRVYLGNKVIGTILVEQDLNEHIERNSRMNKKVDRFELVIWIVLGVIGLVACYLGSLGIWALS